MLPERTQYAYGPAVTTASRSVLLELMTVLRAYRDSLVLVGGWAPYFLLEQRPKRAGQPPHVGSIDIDLAVDAASVDPSAYATIVESLTAHGYRPVEGRRGPSPQSFERLVPSPATGKPYAIRVDFLAPASSVGGARFAAVQDELFARKVRGCEAAFAHQRPIELRGELPQGGGAIAVPVRMADLAGSLTMKGIVLGERYREKDAYDIYMLMKYAGEGPAEVGRTLRAAWREPLGAEALQAIRAAFGSRQAHGPSWVAQFLVPAALQAERDRIMTDAYMVVDECVRQVALPEPNPV
jgi:hypothetical protein